MLSVKEALALFRSGDEIGLSWNGLLLAFDKDNLMDMNNYGDYAVGKICPTGDGTVELELLAMPVRVHGHERE